MLRTEVWRVDYNDVRSNLRQRELGRRSLNYYIPHLQIRTAERTHR